MDAHPTPSEQPLKGPARLVRRAGERLAGVEHPAFHGLPEHVTVEGRRRLPEHLELGTASFTIAYIEIMDGSFAIEELPFAVGDLVTVTYEFDETFVPTPLPGTTSGLDYSGALSALSVVVQAATPTSVDFEQGISVFTASTFDDEPAGSGAYDLLSVFGFTPSAVSGPGLPGGDAIVSTIASFTNTGTLDLVVGGSLPIGTVSNIDVAEVALRLESGAVVRVLNVEPTPAVRVLPTGALPLLATVLGVVGTAWLPARKRSGPRGGPSQARSTRQGMRW